MFFSCCSRRQPVALHLRHLDVIHAHERGVGAVEGKGLRGQCEKMGYIWI